jgi:hypothetical protein
MRRSLPVLPLLFASLIAAGLATEFVRTVPTVPSVEDFDPSPPVRLTDSRTTVITATTDATHVLDNHGTVRFLRSQWGGCDDSDVSYVQYTAAGRIDRVGLGRPAPDVGAMAADLVAAGWSHDYNRGTAEQPTLGLSRDGVRVQLNRFTEEAAVLYELTGPCLHTGRDNAERLLQLPAEVVPT